jgi:hypothetical protein
MARASRTHRPPRQCPVCSEALIITRLACPECDTELSGAFEPCEFCGLPSDDRELLRVFLRARGNMKELERHLGVSYPTARARFDDLLRRLGLQPAAADSRAEVLDALARGEIDVDTATRRLT